MIDYKLTHLKELEAESKWEAAFAASEDVLDKLAGHR